MSYAICRVQKIGGAKDIVGIQIHNRRERTHSNSNPDIRYEHSINNYTLIEATESSYNKQVDAIIKKGYSGTKAIRKDAVKLCEMLFTSDNEFFSQLSEKQQKAFFSDCLKFAKERYGEKNIISATVHLDEATPHMHVDFVPLTANGRLSAKEVIGNRKELQQLQDDFFEKVGRAYNLERGKRTDISNTEIKRHLTTAEYKRSVASQFEHDQTYRQLAIQSLDKTIEALESDVRSLKDKQIKANEMKIKIEDKISKIQRLATNIDEISNPKGYKEKRLFGKKSVEMDIDAFQAIQSWALDDIKTRSEFYKISNELINLKNSISKNYISNDEHNKEIEKLREEINKITETSQILNKKYKSVIDTIQSDPELDNKFKAQVSKRVEAFNKIKEQKNFSTQKNNENRGRSK